MEHLLLKATTSVATDEGVFEAVISAASIDREKDIVDPAGMVRALQKWVPTGKKIPLAWQHSSAPEDQIGYIDPATARVVGNEVVAKGYIDQATDVGAHAWRLVKMGTLGFSFGYLTLDSTPRKGGGRLLKELDVFEVTATPGPMNNDTRVLGWKADMTPAQILASMIALAKDYIARPPDAEDASEMQSILDDLNELVTDADDAADQAEDAEGDKAPTNLSQKDSADVTDKEPEVRSVDPLRRQADAMALEFASDGESRRKSPTPSKPAPPPELMPIGELKRRMREEMLTALSGGLNNE